MLIYLSIIFFFILNFRRLLDVFIFFIPLLFSLSPPARVPVQIQHRFLDSTLRVALNDLSHLVPFPYTY
jgi:hypothetical protein